MEPVRSVIGEKAAFAVVIPTYNNSGTLEAVISSVKKYCSNIIVVNDGSTDSTAGILASIDGIDVISYPHNRGKGYALRRGLSLAREKGFAYAVTMDSDGQHFAEDIPLLLAEAERHPGTLAVGARNLRADNMPSKNTFANRFSNFWYRVETGIRLSDTQSGFRLYPLERIPLRSFLNGYEFELEILVRSAWKGIRVANVPVRVYYPPEGERVSHFRPFRDFSRISLLNTALVLYAILCYYPWKFLRLFSRENLKRFVRENITESEDSGARIAAAIGWGIFCGLLPIWGYQMIFACASAHFLRLNKTLSLVFSNISVPPAIPFIVYICYKAGSFILGTPGNLDFGEMSLQSTGRFIGEYLVGSLVVATLSGCAFFALSYLILSSFRKRRSNG